MGQKRSFSSQGIRGSQQKRNCYFTSVCNADSAQILVVLSNLVLLVVVVVVVAAAVVVAVVVVAERTEPLRIQKGVTFESSLDVDQNSV